MSGWPYKGDLPIARARRVAMAYRARLEKIDPAGCDELDRLFSSWGERWMLSRPVTYDLDDWLEPAQAAEIALTTTANLRRLRIAGKLHGMLGTDGKWRYQAREILRVISSTRSRRPES